MTYPPSSGKGALQKPSWTYNVKRDIDTNMKKSESLTPSKGKDIICGYAHGQNYDSLKFIGPDAKSYKWVTHIPLRSLHGSRYDTVRHALFVSIQRYGNEDPLYGQIVADHTFFDGHVDYTEGCKFTLVSLPDEALHIRSPHVDPAMVVATLQVLKDWEMNTLREQRKKDPVGFAASVDMARKGDLGRLSYWR
ncbi:uncharacterized protein BDR25DRAFT_191554, partial [Lindgomyces ingoldianus]